MKSTIKYFVVFLVMLLACVNAKATSSKYDFEVNGICYEIISVKDVTCRLVSLSSNNDENLVIPSEVEYNNRGFSVIAIKGEAFKDCTHLISVEIPNSVKRIGINAFGGCTSLRSVAMPNSIIEILEQTFQGCTSLVSVEIPNSVQTVGNYAFKNCTSLVSVEIPNSVSGIGDYTFSDCTSLVSVEIPNSVSGIGDYAFKGCTSLLSVEMPNSVGTIGRESFKGCTSLVSIEIPNSVEEIGQSLFEGCASLTSLTIPNSVTKIGAYAFKDCYALQNLTIGEKVKRICFGAFQNCKSLESLTIPGNVMMLESEAKIVKGTETEYYGKTFGGCESLKELNFLYHSIELDVVCYSQIYERFGDGIASEFVTDFIPTSFGKALSLEKMFLDREGISIRNMSLKEITLGEHISKFPDQNESLEKITSYALTPPSSDPFTNNQYMNTIVRVPYEALEAYRSHPIWGNFWFLEGFDASGINDLESNEPEKTVVDRYDISGRRIKEDYKGIAIIRFSDGSTKKVVL